MQRHTMKVELTTGGFLRTNLIKLPCINDVKEDKEIKERSEEKCNCKQAN